jgi:biopolymer transport protein ExbB/TolQ
MANLLDRFKNPRIQRILERQARLAPYVGLTATIYGIIRAISKLESRPPNSVIAPGILDAVLITFEGLVILLLALIVWDWFSNR